MAPYQHHVSSHRRSRRAKRVKQAAIVTVLLAVIGTGAIGLDWFLGELRTSSNTVVSRENTTSVQAANVSVYRTEYYQFQAPEEWISIASESDDTKFVYVKNKNSLITQRLTVFIDREAIDREADFAATHVLPLEVGADGNFANIGEVSDHCDTSWPEGVQRNPTRIIHETVSLVCTPDSRQFNVVVGEVDGNEEVEVMLNDGRKTSLTIVYSNLTATPSPGDLESIISSFVIL